MRTLKIQEMLSKATGRTLTVDYRAGYGWFIVEQGNTLMGFHTRRLLIEYMYNVMRRGVLYTPTVSETYGR